MNKFHKSVLKKEALGFLKVEVGEKYIDATVGAGGHAKGILEKGGIVLGIDADPDAISSLREANVNNLRTEKGNFSHIKKIAEKNGFSQVRGIIFDLGISSDQLESKRGFSFQKEEPLDMRMDPETAVTAYDLVNNLDKRRLNEIFETYGQEKLSWGIASAIYSARKIRPIKTTAELAQIVKEVYEKNRVRSKINPATKTFQALRIVVNSELANLEEALPQTVELLEKGGRLVIISFHSLEDGIVKRFLKKEKTLKALTKKPIGPGPAEILENPRARSAKLRAAEKIII